MHDQAVYFSTSADVYLTLNGEVIPNHALVNLGDIGTIGRIQCHSNDPGHGGTWHAPDGESYNKRNPNYFGFKFTTGQNFSTLEKVSENPTNGIYECLINEKEITHTLRVGIYDDGKGNNNNFLIILILILIMLEGEVALQSISFGLSSSRVNAIFAITCNSTGGPVTTNVWTRNSAPVAEKADNVLNNKITAHYSQILTITERLPGLYTCLISNAVSSDSASLNVTGKCTLSFINIEFFYLLL